MYHFYSKPEFNVRVAIVGQYNNGVLKLAASRCSRKDQFVKRKGRAIAEGRLAKNKLCKEITLSECRICDFINIAKELSKDIAKHPEHLVA